ncbi:Endolytic peptidoglycan transglycosylase RlpA [Neolewinella maritima]|uniref:Probable endolytic peptidoglycan transglycosylase RlpA n=1 Tax=Neolewinella maritima TaxID=1383882 RepID=A0ABN8F965_9BACT|nr:septal ring lytic transglycosylase RlpA family protein [Neolewinella maritima]CAH1000819.1 Endolytic peptidoglycan transglycosylase RlpA [Neolewinella maritima]
MLSSLHRLTVLAVLLLLTLPALAQRTEGQASYYADRFHTLPTSTGETYDKAALTAASKEYPYNSVLEVTNVVSGAKVNVRVNDCGPHHPDRIIDLSKAAARKIGLLRSGVAQVRLRVVSLGTDGPACERAAWASAQREQNAADVGSEIVTDQQPQVAVPVPPKPAPPTTTAPATPPVVKVDRVSKAPQRPRKISSDAMLFGVQVGAFGKQANAERLAATLVELGFGDVWTAQVGKIFRVFTGKYYFQDEAETLKAQVRQAGYRDASVRRVQ